MVYGLTRLPFVPRSIWRNVSKVRKHVDLRARDCASLPQQCSAAKKRVIGVVAHIDAGKTTTTERMLYYAGSVRRMGNVDSGSTVMDYMPEERERGITINSAAISFPWNSHQVNLIDTPGHLDFYIEVERSLLVMDGIVAIIDAVAGVQPQTETVWRQANNHNLPRVIFVNKLDREGANLSYALSTVRERLNVKPLLLFVPVAEADTRKVGTLVDLISLEAISYDPCDTEGRNPIRTALTDAEKTPQILAAREELIERVAEVDDTLMTAFIEGSSISRRMLREAVRTATISRRLTPVICGTALKNRGIQPLLDSVVEYLPSPLEREPLVGQGKSGTMENLEFSEDGEMIALAFKVLHDVHRGRMVYFRIFSGSLSKGKILFNKSRSMKERPTKLLRISADDAVEIDSARIGDIVAATGMKETSTGDTLTTSDKSIVQLAGVEAPPSVFSAAIEAESLNEENKLLQSLTLLLSEDPSLSVTTDAFTNQMLLCGMGELHLETAHRRLQEHFKVKCSLSNPRVAYKESIVNATTRVHKYNRMIGAKRLAAELRIACSPNGLQTNKVEISKAFQKSPNGSQSIQNNEVSKAIDEAVRNALDRGTLLGMPTTGVDVKVSPATGPNSGFHASAAAYAACAGEGIAKCLEDGKGILMEPVMTVHVEVEEAYVGDVVSDLSDSMRRRGIVEEVAREDGKIARISANVPLEGMIGWSTKLRSLTKGRGTFVMEYKGYQAADEPTQRRVLGKFRGF